MDEVALNDFIKAFDFEAVLPKPVAEQAEALTAVLTDAFAKFVPVKNVIIRSNDQPWVNSYTRLCSGKRIEITSFSKKLTVNF